LIPLIKGAGFFVYGVFAIARRLKVFDSVSGLTVAAFGTSTVEFFVSSIVSIQGDTEIAVGTSLPELATSAVAASPFNRASYI
jgi:Ca2+/Na+ antiporter